jgi:UDP-N-acetyl-D-mannosaminuronic acid dehydrogenase
MQFHRVCILGLGYIGLPTACMFANQGIHVVGVDINSNVIEQLSLGKIHIHEPGLADFFHENVVKGTITFSLKPEPADAFIIAVPTPFYDNKKADLTAVKAAAESIVPVLAKSNLVVLESTSPPETTAKIVAPILEKSGFKAGKDFHLVYSPERVLPGKILHELINNDRVIGGINTVSAEQGKALYASFVKGQIFLTDAVTAEMVKLMENTYRDVNIALANEFSRLADRFGVDAWEAIKIANHHPRVRILNPGPGVGGHCISVDPWFLVEVAPDITPLIKTARQVNDSQPEFVIQTVKKTIGSLDGKRITLLGLAYKPNVDDFRESPSLEIARLLEEDGAVVTCFDPYLKKPLNPVHTVPDLVEAVRDCDAVILAVAHSELLAISPQMMADLTLSRLAFDLVNCWSEESWRAAGFNLVRLGVGENNQRGGAQ